MFKNMNVMVMVLFLVLLAVLAGCSGQEADTEEAPQEVERGDAVEGIDARALIDNSCGSCHGLSKVYSNRNSEAWPAIVVNMTGRTGRPFSDEEVEAITLYLQENYSN